MRGRADGGGSQRGAGETESNSAESQKAAADLKTSTRQAKRPAGAVARRDGGRLPPASSQRHAVVASGVWLPASLRCQHARTAAGSPVHGERFF